ncbi:MAG TPA: hypothetical protein PKC18_09690, partial [Lacipirellulaceae bacterium]|nr:hypothetical protein [Lacipirellulaceae bacterium]
ANSVFNGLPNEAGFSPHTGYNLRMPLTLLVPDEAANLFAVKVPDLAQDVRLHRAVLGHLDEERQIQRDEQRARSAREFARTRSAARTFEPGTLVMARAPAAERRGSALDKVLQRLEYTGVWRVVAHDRSTERVTLRLVVPAPTFDASEAIETDYEIVVHSQDVRFFGEGAHDQYDEELAPLNLLHDIRWNAWNRATLSAGEISDISRRIKDAVGRLLTEEQRKRASKALDTAIEQWFARDRIFAEAAAGQVLRTGSRSGQLAGPPAMIAVKDVLSDGTVVGEIARHPRIPQTEVRRKAHEFAPGDARLVREWFAQQDARRAAEIADMRRNVESAELGVRPQAPTAQ